MSKLDAPGTRAAALLFSLAAIGALLGVSWERVQDEPAPKPLASPAPAPRLPMPPAPADALPARALEGLPSYAGAAPRALADDFLGRGLPLSAAWFATPDPLDQVLAFYRRALLEEGIPVVEHRYSEAAGYIGYMNPETEELHLVSVLSQGGETLVFPSVAQVSQLSALPWPQELPRPAGAVARMSLMLPLERGRQHLAIARLPMAELAGEVSAYSRVLTAAGWELDPVERPSPSEARFQARRDGARADVSLRRRRDGLQLYVRVAVAGPSDAPEEE